jgi:hypothetical protein
VLAGGTTIEGLSIGVGLTLPGDERYGSISESIAAARANLWVTT